MTQAEIKQYLRVPIPIYPSLRNPSRPTTSQRLIPSHVPDASWSDESNQTGGSYGKDRALARQNALADQLRNSIKGEIEPSADDDFGSKATTTSQHPGANLGDELYRNVVALYEENQGREPEFGDPRQTGWDIRSIDSKTGDIRLIEVKGKGCPWIGDEVVEISQAQARKAWQNEEWLVSLCRGANWRRRIHGTSYQQPRSACGQVDPLW